MCLLSIVCLLFFIPNLLNNRVLARKLSANASAGGVPGILHVPLYRTRTVLSFCELQQRWVDPLQPSHWECWMHRKLLDQSWKHAKYNQFYTYADRLGSLYKHGCSQSTL